MPNKKEFNAVNCSIFEVMTNWKAGQERLVLILKIFWWLIIWNINLFKWLIFFFFLSRIVTI